MIKTAGLPASFHGRCRSMTLENGDEIFTGALVYGPWLRGDQKYANLIVLRQTASRIQADAR